METCINDNFCIIFQEYKNLLRNLFRPQNKIVIFMETSMNFRRYPHAVLECIPVPEEEGDMAPFYFKVIKVLLILNQRVIMPYKLM